MESQLRSYFYSVDVDQSGEITPVELQKVLVNGDWSPFDLVTVKLLVTMFDAKKSGSLTFDEFRGLWTYIAEWQKCFVRFDTDRSNEIAVEELHQALQQFGLSVSLFVVQAIVRKERKRGKKGIDFDAFIKVCVAVKMLKESFEKLGRGKSTAQVSMDFDLFLQTALVALP